MISGSLLGSNPLLLEARSHRSSERKTPFFLTINATWTFPDGINFADFDFENTAFIFSLQETETLRAI